MMLRSESLLNCLITDRSAVELALKDQPGSFLFRDYIGALIPVVLVVVAFQPLDNMILCTNVRSLEASCLRK